MDVSDTFVREFPIKRYAEQGDEEIVLNLHQLEIGDVGCVVWDAAMVLSKYLEHIQNASGCSEVSFLNDKIVLELGAGTGIVGLVMASLWTGPVTLTDLSDFIPLMRKNVEANRRFLKAQVECKELVWGKAKFDEKPDVILLADCLYYKESLDPLVETLQSLASVDTTILCCHEDRSDRGKKDIQEQFFKLMDVQFVTDQIPLEDQHPEFNSSDIFIHRFRRRK